MAAREILIFPDKRLRRVAQPIVVVDAVVQRLVADMFETMYAAAGIGLAPIQIGEPWRIVTIDVAGRNEPRQARAFINPELTWRSEALATYAEGCLSIPGYYEEVERSASVRVRYLDLDGARQDIEANGLLAICLQHEIDHLDGGLFIDHISRLKRERITKRLTKAVRQSAARSAMSTGGESVARDWHRPAIAQDIRRSS